MSRQAADEDIILEDCVLNIYEQEHYNHCFRLASALGASISDTILPAFTTHVVVASGLYTLQLKSELTELKDKA